MQLESIKKWNVTYQKNPDLSNKNKLSPLKIPELFKKKNQPTKKIWSVSEKQIRFTKQIWILSKISGACNKKKKQNIGISSQQKSNACQIYEFHHHKNQ